MGIPAKDNSPGFHEFLKTAPESVYFFSNYWGSPEESRSDYTVEYPGHTCSRSFKVNNPVRALSAAGPQWRDPSAYERRVCEVTSTPGTWRREQNGLNYRGDPFTIIQSELHIHREHLFYWDFTEGGYSLAGGGPGIPSNEENYALAKALSHLKDSRTSWGENLAEAVKTYSQLTSEVGNLLAALRAVKHGNFRQAANAIRDGRGILRRGADIYLQYKFGWKPLVEDVYGLAGLLTEQLKPALLMYSKAGMPKKTFNLLPKSGYERSGSVRMTGHVRLTGKINESQSRLPDQLGLSNPLSLGWDLIPWSFVVDWALPIGDSLDSLTAPLGLDFVGGYASARYEGELQSKLLLDWWTDAVEVSPRINTYRVFDLIRKTYSDWPKVGLYVKSPFSLSHGLTSIALAIQQLRG